MKTKNSALTTIFSAFVFLIFAIGTTHAAIFTVNNNGDAGDAVAGNGVCETVAGNGICTLRAAVQEAAALAGDDTVKFATSVTNVAVASEIAVSNPAGAMTIEGNGAKVTTIDAGSTGNRIFNFTFGTFTVASLTLTGGRTAAGGGAIMTSSAQTTLVGLNLENNQATSENASSNGGAVLFNGSTSVVLYSTFTNNSGFNCGGLSILTGTAYIANSTFSNNTARGAAGGGFCTQSAGTAFVRNSTVVNNRVTGSPFPGGLGGGGIRINGSLNIGNSIVAGNTSTGSGAGIDVRLDAGTITTVGGNLLGDNTGANTASFATTGAPNANNDYVGTTGAAINALLGPLAFDLAGQTKVHIPLAGSPAIDHGIDANAVNPLDSQPLPRDQRGLLRIVDGGAFSPLALRVDIGAVEFNSTTTAAPVSISGRVLSVDGGGVRNAIVVLVKADGQTVTARTSSFGNYRFDGIESGQTVSLSVNSKFFRFSPRIVDLQDDVAAFDFFAEK